MAINLADQKNQATINLSNQVSEQRSRIMTNSLKAKQQLRSIRLPPVEIKRGIGGIQIVNTNPVQKQKEQALRDIDKTTRQNLENVNQAHKEALNQLDESVRNAELEQKKVDLTNQEELNAFNESNEQLDTGEYINKEDFYALPEQDQKDLKSLGLEQFKAKKDQELEEFEKNNVKLDTGEYISKVEYAKLDSQEQESIKQFGIDKFNALQEEKQYQVDKEYSDTASEFTKKYALLDNGEYIERDSFESLSGEDKDLIRKVGTEEFNRIQKQRDQEFDNTHVKISNDRYIDKGEWDSLSYAQQIEVMMTGNYTVNQELQGVQEQDQKQTITTTVMLKKIDGTEIELSKEDWDSMSELKKVETYFGRQPTTNEWASFKMEEAVEKDPTLKKDWKDAFVLPYSDGEKEVKRKHDILFQVGRDADKEYVKEYPNTGIGQYAASAASTLGMSSVNALAYKGYKTSVEEIAVSAASAASWALPFTKGPVLIGLSAATSGVFGYETAKNWDKLTPIERMIGIGGTALVAAPALGALKSTVGKFTPTIVTKPILTNIKINKPITFRKVTTTLGNDLRIIENSKFKVELHKPITAKTEGFYTYPIKAQFPFKIVTTNLEKAGLSSSLSKSAYQSGKVYQALIKSKPNDTLLDVNLAAKKQLINNTSFNADLKFIKEFSNVKSLNSKQIQLLEKTTGYKGLGSKLTKFAEDQKQLQQLNKTIETSKISSKERIDAEQQKLSVGKSLKESQQALADLLQPRYKPSLPSAKFEGYNMKWETKGGGYSGYNPEGPNPNPKGGYGSGGKMTKEEYTKQYEIMINSWRESPYYSGNAKGTPIPNAPTNQLDMFGNITQQGLKKSNVAVLETEKQLNIFNFPKLIVAEPKTTTLISTPKYTQPTDLPNQINNVPSLKPGLITELDIPAFPSPRPERPSVDNMKSNEVQQAVDDLNLTKGQQIGIEPLTKPQYRTLVNATGLPENMIMTHTIIQILNQPGIALKVLTYLKNETKIQSISKVDLKVGTLTNLKVNTSLRTQVVPLTSTQLQTKTLTETQLQNRTQVEPKVSTKVRTEEQTGKRFNPKSGIGITPEGEQVELPVGTIVWRMGTLKNDVWRAIRPDEEKSIMLADKPTEYYAIDTGKGSAYKTVGVIGGVATPRQISLGIMDIDIDVVNGEPVIRFKRNEYATGNNTPPKNKTRWDSMDDGGQLIGTEAKRFRPQETADSKTMSRNSKDIWIEKLKAMRENRLATTGRNVTSKLHPEIGG